MTSHFPRRQKCHLTFPFLQKYRLTFPFFFKSVSTMKTRKKKDVQVFRKHTTTVEDEHFPFSLSKFSLNEVALSGFRVCRSQKTHKGCNLLVALCCVGTVAARLKFPLTETNGPGRQCMSHSRLVSTLQLLLYL